MGQILGELIISLMVSLGYGQANNVENFLFVGADDVIVFKPNSTMITIRNVTSYGTTGLSFGSIGQYPGVVSTVFRPKQESIDYRPISLRIFGSRMSSSTAPIRSKDLVESK
jgi:hypothetical protein